MGLFDAIRDTQGSTTEYSHYMAGAWQKAGDGETFAVTNPATGETIARAPSATTGDVEEAIERARRGAAAHSFAPPERLAVMERARDLLHAHADEITRIMAMESGKPLASCRKELHTAARRLQLTREEARTLYGEYIPGEWVRETAGTYAIVTRRPLGVVAALSPFNYPLFIGAAKIIPALVAGNAVVAKPASDTPLSMLLFARILEEAGTPAGMLSVLTGSGSRIGKPITGSPHVAAISFTGSTSVGERIAENAGMKKLHLELGGKAAAIVLDDADLSLAAHQVCKGVFSLSGQRCDAISRVLVQKKIKDRFLEETLNAAENYRLGDPLDDDTVMGPLINQAAVDKVRKLVDDSRHGGATIIRGGRHEELYFQPTIIDKVDPGMSIAREEIFGPVMPIVTVADDAEALEISNASEYGLDGCVFTSHLDRAMDIAANMQDGTVTINGAPSHGVGHFPFGGNNRSGIGREGLKYSIDELTRIHTIVVSRH
jgi:acyl-CoA reductase-like NAD-dependent aldehyde dehydrogenase